MYSIEFLPSAAKAFSKLERRVQVRVARRIDRLAGDPRADAVKLRGADDIWRARVGDYRVLYQIADDRLIVLIVRIEHERGRLVGRKASGRDIVDELYGSLPLDESVDDYLERARGR